MVVLMVMVFAAQAAPPADSHAAKINIPTQNFLFIAARSSRVKFLVRVLFHSEFIRIQGRWVGASRKGEPWLVEVNGEKTTKKAPLFLKIYFAGQFILPHVLYRSKG